jgi:hypothetical protein
MHQWLLAQLPEHEQALVAVGTLDLPPHEPGVVNEDRTAWRYGLSGSLPETLRQGAVLLPIARYYGDLGAHVVALHVRREDGACPHFIAKQGDGFVVVYATSTKEWFAFFARLALREIGWWLTS